MSDDAHSLSQRTTEPVFLVTTENALGRSRRRRLFGVFSVVSLLLIALGVWKTYDAELRIGRGAQGADDVGVGTHGESRFAMVMGVAAIINGLFLILILRLLLRFGGVRGAWVLDQRGIEFQSVRGQRRMLEWPAVRAVANLWGSQIWFRGDGTKMILWLGYEDRQAADGIRQAMIRWLGNEFDLRRVGIDPQTNWQRIVKWLAVAVPIIVVLLGIHAVVAYREPYQEGRWLAPSVGVALLAISLPLVILHARKLQKQSAWRHRQIPGH